MCNLLFRCHPPTVLFNAVWCRNIKYLSNPWTTSLSQFSLVWVFKNTHADWPTSNKNAFKGVGEEGGIGGGGVASVRAHQSLCVCAALARWGFQMARSANRPGGKKKESVSRVQAGDVWRFCIPEKQPRLGRPPSGRPPLILFISGSQKQCQQAITVPPSQTIYVPSD